MHCFALRVMTSFVIQISQSGNVTSGSQLVSALSQQTVKQQQNLVNSMDHLQHNNNSSSPPSSVSSAPSPLPSAGTPTPSPAQQPTHQGSILPTLNGPITSKVSVKNSPTNGRYQKLHFAVNKVCVFTLFIVEYLKHAMLGLILHMHSFINVICGP